jgi:hypothetical protein
VKPGLNFGLAGQSASDKRRTWFPFRFSRAVPSTSPEIDETPFRLFVVRRMRALLVLPLLLAACQTTWDEGAAITSASGQRLCAKHRIPLVPLHAYEYPPNYVILGPHEASRPYYGVAEQYCPNHIPERVSLVRAGIMRSPTTVFYCPLCEKEFHDRLSVPDEKAAIKFAREVLSTESNSRTKGPYRVTLAKDVWAVRCSLANGRSASIEIGKDGSEVSSQIPR